MTQAENMFTAVEELTRLGASLFCVVPGSRSTPIVLAAIENDKANVVTFHDERAAGFFAVGAARAGLLPVVITTSGTAVANLLPSVVEANADRLAVIYMTGDRPVGAHGRGANQTIDQQNIFSTHVVEQLNIDRETAVLENVSRSVASAVTARRPLHINVHLEKPLDEIVREPPTALEQWYASGRPLTEPQSVTREFVRPEHFDLLVVGQCDTALQRFVETVSETHYGDSFYDVQSNSWRLGNIHLSEIAGRENAPKYQHALVVGRRFTEHRIWEFLREHVDTLTQVVDLDGVWDPIGVFEDRAGDLVRSPTQPLGEKRSEAQPQAFTHREIVMAIASNTGPFSSVFIGNSLVIRAFDRFRARGRFSPGAQIYANRGASGIDGNIATSAGIALATGWPTLCVIGDQTALHDIGSLASLKSLGIRLRIVIIDNSGGRIFEHLPQLEDKTLEDFYVADPDIDIGDVCRGFGIPVVEVLEREALDAAIQTDVQHIDVVVAKIDPHKDFEDWRRT